MAISNTAEMRSFLIEQMVAVAEGKVESGDAKVMCNIAQQVYNTVKLEMQFAQMKEKIGVKSMEAVSWSGQQKTRSLRAA